jgi:hypothetical protein
MGFKVRGLGFKESGFVQDPYQQKYAFSSITRVPLVQIEHVRAHLKGLSAKIVMSPKSVVIYACGLLSNPAKVPQFQYRAGWYSIDRKFHTDYKKLIYHFNYMIAEARLLTNNQKMCSLFPWQHGISSLFFYRLVVDFT